MATLKFKVTETDDHDPFKGEEVVARFKLRFDAVEYLSMVQRWGQPWREYTLYENGTFIKSVRGGATLAGQPVTVDS